MIEQTRNEEKYVTINATVVEIVLKSQIVSYKTFILSISSTA